MDVYHNYAKLDEAETESVDFCVSIVRRGLSYSYSSTSWRRDRAGNIGSGEGNCQERPVGCRI